MTLRKKTVIIIAVTITCLIVVLYAISRLIMLENFAELEEQHTRQDVEQALSALSRELSSLDTMTYDWSAWDDTYAFIKDANTEYIKSNLVDGTFADLRLNLMLFIDSSGGVIFGKAFELYNEEEILVPQSFLRHLSGDSLLLRHPDTESSVTGIVLLPEGPMLIASHPILTSEDEGPIRGTLIFGRYLDSSEIDRLAETTLLSLTTYRVDDKQMPPDFQAARLSLSSKAPILIRPLDAQYIAGYALLTDIYGKASLVLRVDASRDIYEQGQIIIAYLVLTIVVVGLVVGAVVMLLLEKQVLSRLAHLNKGVSSIATSGDLSTRVSMTGADELSNLASTINGMMEALELSLETLRESEEFCSSLEQNSPNPMTVISPDTSIKYVNPALEKLTGFSSAELIGRKPPYPWWPEENQQQYSKTFEDVMRKGTHSLERLFQRKNGERFWVEITSTPIRRDRKLTYFLSNWVDITERKQADAKLQELYQHEKDLRQELETEINNRIEFTRALVHELKTPITPVLASSELLVEELKDEPLIGLAKNINRGASNLNRRIDELLDLARGEIGMLGLNPKPVDPMQLLQGIVGDVTPVALSNGQSLSLELPSSLPVVWADEDRLRQVVLNLINNAFKFTPAGGKIILRAKEDGANLVVEVQDTGRGISDEEQQRLFQPYHRLESDREHLSGLGLGLSLSKKLVELHGGQIWVKSRKGKGSTFGFSVPLEAASQREKGVETGGKS